MKEVCHKRDSTSAFNMKKLSQESIDVSARRYGRQHEKSAIASYVNHHRARGVTVSVQPCGLHVDESSPWLAASPDGIVLDPTQSGDNQKGCLEVKCPILCQKSLISDVYRKSSPFCLKEENGEIQLSTTHAYYYQIQTEMHVIRLQWCDFVVWSPIEDTFVQRVYYNKPFMENIIAKAQAFYFEKYLPSIIPYMIATTSDSGLITVKPVPTIPPTVKPASTVLPIVKSAPTIPPTVKPASTIHPTVKPGLSIQRVSAQSGNLLPLTAVLEQINVVRHLVDGDGSCMYHAVAHQADFISKSSRGDKFTSNLLRQLVCKMMDECPHVRKEDGLSMIQWLEKRQTVLDPSEWGGDLELRLLAIGLKRDIAVITSVDNGKGTYYARRYPCEPKPSQKMRGGIFIPLTCNELFKWWQVAVPSPLVLIFNGFNHYDSTSSLM